MEFPQKIINNIWNAARAAIRVTNENDVEAGYVKYDPSDAKPTYIGINSNPDANDNDTNWIIYKYTYSGSDATSLRKKIGSWTDRATLF